MSLDLSISNIAWPAEHDEEALELLARLGVRGLEVAPTKIWPDPGSAPPEEAERLAEAYRRRGLRVVAAQSLLYGRPDLTLFDGPEPRRRTLDYLDRVVRLCAAMGAESLVFGSPKNRRIGDQDPEAVRPSALEFFGQLAEMAERHGTAVVLEANPPEYGADFVTRAVEAAELVRQVGQPGLRLHLDTACMSLAGDDCAAVLAGAANLLHHFHISEPRLEQVTDATLDHPGFAACLRRSGFDRWVSIEMRPPEPFDLKALEEAILWARRTYLSA